MSAKEPAFGGVVVDDEGRILLRKVRRGYGGAEWTFPKGRPEPDEPHEATAVREATEETGIHARVIERIPGIYDGTFTRTTYYLMRPTGKRAEHDKSETAEVRWATPDEAHELLQQSPDAIVRARDLKVLKAALDICRDHGLL
jgi:8-oxo-dGTP pyrophosphatase MutT (NUDIX family)